VGAKISFLFEKSENLEFFIPTSTISGG